MAEEVNAAAGISYRSDFGLWWPDYDHSPERCHKRVLDQLTDMDLAIARCRRREVCVQAGGHAGLWPLRLAQVFKRVITFECERMLFDCLRRNIVGTLNIMAYSYALGAAQGEAKLRPAVSAGSWRIDPGGRVPVLVQTIDALELTQCDAIFLDIEGHEAPSLQGAAKTIAQFRPVLHVEELPRSRKAIRAQMKRMGYRCVGKVHSDFIYVAG